jgi:trehalose 6-phosphate synthase/phosphatase
LRQRIPDGRIGFFLHIPFPAAELFATLPAREAVLRGLLGADLVGFHTAGYARHFADAAARVLHARTTRETVELEGRVSRIGVFPMGVDAKALAERAAAPEVDREIEHLVAGADDVALFVGIDRLDYTKGIPRRLLAFERLLANHPELHERVRLIQVAVPSRTAVPAYRSFRQQVDGVVGRINSEFGTARWAPVHYLYRSLPEAQLLALYRAARVMLVTPVRDGMNLVAKEFVATRRDEDGVLVLSEFVGAADELVEALFVNPHDVDGSAAVYHRALVMSREERRTRMRALRAHVLEYDVHVWAESFLAALDEADAPTAPPASARTAHARDAS